MTAAAISNRSSFGAQSSGAEARAAAQQTVDPNGQRPKHLRGYAGRVLHDALRHDDTRSPAFTPPFEAGGA